MKTEIIIDKNNINTRVALVEDGRLAELYAEQNNEKSPIGNIYKGKVDSVIKGMQAAFIDIGQDKNAFLYIGDINNPNIKEGNDITVQLIKEAMGGKGARVTKNITLPGRCLVLIPGRGNVNVSKKIKNNKEHERLYEAAKKYRPDGYGIVIRTAAMGVKEKNLAKEIRQLKNYYEKVKKYSKKAKAPECIHHEPGIIERTMRDFMPQDLEKISVNDNETHKSIAQWLSSYNREMKNKLRLYKNKYDIFGFFNIEKQAKAIFNKKILLPCGGDIIIDPTEALTVIDVNSGKNTGGRNLEETVVITNKEAAVEAARQIRLRDIGGIIIIDFIDMYDKKNKNEILKILKREMSKDRTKTCVVGITGLGLVEVTRRRIRKETAKILTRECRVCDGTGRIPVK